MKYHHNPYSAATQFGGVTHGIKDSKTLWEAIKARFGGNKESKKMQKTIMKQQYENFTASRSEGLDKTYDRFQKLISQLENSWFHAVPPPYTGNYMPLRPDLSFAGLDDSVYKTKVSENETSIFKTSKDIVEKPKTIRPSAHIIEDWDTDSNNDSVFRPKSDQTKPRFTKINFVKSDKNVKSVNKENTH
ncbi:hypothetical protein Tco_0022735, partial [Tanacetum coccineum]